MPVQAYESPEQYLKRIREHTCYEALRGVIAFITTLLIGVAIFVSLAGVAALVLQGQPGFNSSSQGVVIGMAVGSFFASALIIVFALAAKQSMSLLVDIADISLEANRRK